MVKGVIFDFDGLLVDTEMIWYEILSEYFMDTHDYVFDIRDYNSFVGSSGSTVLVDLFSRFGMNHDEVMVDIRKEFINRSNNMELMPGVIELIDDLKKRGIQFGIATSSPLERPTRILKSMGSYDLFDFILGREDVEKAKPAPDLFLKALNVMGLNKDEVLVLEDSLNGYKAARAAGIDVIIVPNEVTKYSDFENASVIGSLVELELV